MPKIIGNNIYLHVTAIEIGSEIHRIVSKAFKLVPNVVNPIVLKINLKANEISFIECDNWDTAPEPFVGDSYKVNLNTNKVTFRKARKNNPQIYHHKWMFVNEDYTGFDIEESKERSRAWESLAIDIDKKRIGNYDYWKENVEKYLV